MIDWATEMSNMCSRLLAYTSVIPLVMLCFFIFGVAQANAMNTAPIVMTNPLDDSIPAGSTTIFSAAATGNPVPTVQWQLSADGGATFSNVSGATSTSLVVSSVTASQNGNQYRAVFTNIAGTATTTVATLTVRIIPNVTLQPVSQTIAVGGTATFTAAASGNPVPTVQWQLSTNGGATFANIAGATSTTLSFVANAGNDNNRYRAVFTNNVGTDTTQSATLTVNTAPIVTTNPLDDSIPAGSTTIFSAAATGNPVPTVQWQLSADGGATFSNVSGATSTSLVVSSVTASQNGNQYRAVFTNIAGTATTTVATLTVRIIPNVTLQPVSQTIAVGGTATFTAAASGNPVPTVQWQLSTNGGATFANIAGATSTTLSFVANAGNDNNRYRAVFTNNVGTDTTQSATLTVGKLANIITFAAITNQTIGGSPVVLSPTASSGLTVSLIDTTMGVCSLSGTSISLLAVGTCTIEATQSGDATYASATLVSRSFQITKANVTIALASSVPTVYFGLPVTFTAQVSGVSPTGTVTFYDGTTPIGSVALTGGLAALTTNSLAIGDHNITATYSGDGSNNASTSIVVALAVGVRPDPTQDASVKGNIDNQYSTENRYARAHMDLVNGRLDRLHSEDEESFEVSVAYQDQRDASDPSSTVSSTADVTLSKAFSRKSDYHVWASGTVIFGKATPAGNSNFTTDGLAIGVDTRLSDNLKAGLALGVASDYSFIGTDGSTAASTNLSATAYASLHVLTHTFIDVLAGYGEGNFDLNRFVIQDSSFVTGKRHGSQLYGSLIMTQDERIGDLKFSPYLRLDAINIRLDKYSEVGNAIWALSYENATATSISGVAGINMEYPITMEWGRLTPLIGLAYRQSFAGGLNQGIGYADLGSSSSYALTGVDVGASGFTGTLGLRAATFKNIDLDLIYKLSIDDAVIQSQSVTATFRLGF